VLYEVEKKTNKELKKFSDENIKLNPYSNMWKWQEFPFNENMLETMKDIAPALYRISDSTEAKLYNFKTFKLNLT